jgi:hypothetical protein
VTLGGVRRWKVAVSGSERVQQVQETSVALRMTIAKETEEKEKEKYIREAR